MILRLAFLDAETSALPDRCQYAQCAMTELGIYIFDLDTATWKTNERATFQSYVKPVDGCFYDPASLRYQSQPDRPITLDFLEANGKPEEEVMGHVKRFLFDHMASPIETWGPRIWSQSADFDHGFVRAANVRTFGNAGFVEERCNWSCSRKLFTNLATVGVHNEPNPSMRYIRAHYGIPDVGTHTALGDAKAGVQAVAAMLRDMSRVKWA